MAFLYSQGLCSQLSCMQIIILKAVKQISWEPPRFLKGAGDQVKSKEIFTVGAAIPGQGLLGRWLTPDLTSTLPPREGGDAGIGTKRE